LGYSQYKNLPAIQIADITGVYGVSFLVVLINFSVFSSIKMAIRCCKTHKRLFEKSSAPLRDEIRFNPLMQTIAVFFTVIAVLAYGYYRIDIITREDLSVRRLKISVVQGNIEQLHKWDAAYKGYIMEKYKKLTLEAAKDNPDIIVWPETSLPGYPDKESRLSTYIQQIIKSIKTSLLIGAPTIAKIKGEDIGDYNSALLFSKNGRLAGTYDKLHLVAFGEFIPLEKYFPFLRNILPITGNFISGKKFTIFKLTANGQRPTANFGVLICFEDIFPNLVRRFVKDGADFMINITNDAWFGKTAAAYQHAANSVFRAVENRSPFIRSANTGLSCFIDRAGWIYDSVNIEGAELFVAGYKTACVHVPAPKLESFYTRYGDIFMLICLFAGGVFIIDYLRRGRYNK
jgi:apolipoprotein N-acyltransferase